MSPSRTNAPANYNPNNSFEVSDQPPSDYVSSINFSPVANFLVATSWDKQVRCWEIIRNRKVLKSVLKASISHDQPVLCSAWTDDGRTVFSGGYDKQVKMWPLMGGGDPTIVATHDAPIKDIAWIQEKKVLVTGSWDNTIKYRDMRHPNPFHTQKFSDRLNALAVRYPLMVVGTADRNLTVLNLENIPLAEVERIKSPLEHQTSCVAFFPDKKGFVVGSIGGTVGIQRLYDSQEKNFSMECHKDGNEVYSSVDSINFHPLHHRIISTSGSDGTFNFWNLKNGKQLTAMARSNQRIPCSAFNYDGSMFAYSACYDWSKVAEKYSPATAQTHLFIHTVELSGMLQDADKLKRKERSEEVSPGRPRSRLR